MKKNISDCDIFLSNHFASGGGNGICKDSVTNCSCEWANLLIAERGTLYIIRLDCFYQAVRKIDKGAFVTSRWYQVVFICNTYGTATVFNMLLKMITSQIILLWIWYSTAAFIWVIVIISQTNLIDISTLDSIVYSDYRLTCHCVRNKRLYFRNNEQHYTEEHPISTDWRLNDNQLSTDIFIAMADISSALGMFF